jgi:poly-gamma-glutamate synthesis protein (capsule biosynthesis protein)
MSVIALSQSLENTAFADLIQEETEPVVEEYNLSLLAVGDNLIHSPIYNKAYIGNGEYDFTPMYANVKDFVSSYDLAVINEETILVNDDRNISSYPCFGTPIEMGNALIDTGFDVILSATNHTWDKKLTGVVNTIDFYKQFPDIILLGVHDSVEDYNTVDIIEKNGIKLAMFNYTYGLNGFTVPSDKYYMVDLLDNKEKFISDIQSVENDVDFTIAFLHIGTEYTYTPTTYQVNYINDVIDAGADIVICFHPHVIEPYGEVTTPNGNTGLVYYSCGNFISGQTEVPRVLGGMASINLKKETTDGVVTSVSIDSFDFIPVVTHYTKTEHTVYLLDDYTEELASKHTLHSKGLTLQSLWDLWNKVISN